MAVTFWSYACCEAMDMAVSLRCSTGLLGCMPRDFMKDNSWPGISASVSRAYNAKEKSLHLKQSHMQRLTTLPKNNKYVRCMQQALQ